MILINFLRLEFKNLLLFSTGFYWFANVFFLFVNTEDLVHIYVISPQEEKLFFSKIRILIR